MPTDTLTLADFILARIEDQETLAHDMAHQSAMGRPFIDTGTLAGGTLIRELIDPARVRAQCKAHRALVELADTMNSRQGSLTLRALAAIDAGHEDYRAEEWSL